jgi:hypothetical protein
MEGHMMDEKFVWWRKVGNWNYTKDEILSEKVENGWKNGSIFLLNEWNLP